MRCGLDVEARLRKLEASVQKVWSEATTERLGRCGKELPDSRRAEDSVWLRVLHPRLPAPAMIK